MNEVQKEKKLSFFQRFKNWVKNLFKVSPSINISNVKDSNIDINIHK